MKYGLTSDDIWDIQEVLVNFPQVEKAILFGSRAKGNFRPNSDIDLCLVGQDLDLGLQFEIENALDDLLLPYKIDLSILHHIDNPKLVEHIERAGVQFFASAHANRN